MIDTYITGKRFLIVEDNHLNREVAKSVLSRFDAKLELAINGYDAIKKVKFHEPSYYDVILLDINLPDISGYDVADQIRKIPGCEKENLNIIALSISPLIEERGQSLNGYCRKPFTIEEIISLLK